MTWKTRVPVAALRHVQPDDLFWAALRVTAFSDDMIRALARTAGYSSRDDERHLADVLIQRRNKIASAYLTVVNPLVDIALSPAGALSFGHAAAAAGVMDPPAGGYRVSWARFDNTAGTTTPLGETTTAHGEAPHAPHALPATPGSFVQVQIRTLPPADAAWAPVRASFRRSASEWTLVGLERTAR